MCLGRAVDGHMGVHVGLFTGVDMALRRRPTRRRWRSSGSKVAPAQLYLDVLGPMRPMWRPRWRALPSNMAMWGCICL